MERRKFLRAAGAGAGAATIGSVFWGRAAIARAGLTNQLVADASHILVNKEHEEITTIPGTAAEEMKLWFTGACLNSAQFIEHICSEGFSSRLSHFGSQREREMCVENEFFSRVVSHSAIYQRVELIASESGATLDRNWKTCCEQVAHKWQLKLRPNSEDVVSDIQTRLDHLISASLNDAISRATNVADRPSALSSAIGIGKASIVLLPLAKLPPPYNIVAIPAFALVALTHFANYAVGRLAQDANRAKAAISDRLALLGSRVASEFKAELGTRITDLHMWQNDSLRQTAGEYARENIGLL